MIITPLKALGVGVTAVAVMAAAFHGSLAFLLYYGFAPDESFYKNGCPGWDTRFLLFQSQAIVEGLPHLFSQRQIMMVHRVLGDGLQLGNIYLAVFTQHRLVGRYIDDPAHQTAGFRIIGNKLTLQSHRQLVDQRRIHKF